MPWEGRADHYRDQPYHGGIFALGFIGNWWSRTPRIICSAGRVVSTRTRFTTT